MWARRRHANLSACTVVFQEEGLRRSGLCHVRWPWFPGQKHGRSVDYWVPGNLKKSGLRTAGCALPAISQLGTHGPEGFHSGGFSLRGGRRREGFLVRSGSCGPTPTQRSGGGLGRFPCPAPLETLSSSEVVGGCRSAEAAASLMALTHLVTALTQTSSQTHLTRRPLVWAAVQGSGVRTLSQIYW